MTTRKKGSFKRRGQVVPRGERKWLIRAYVGEGADGRKKYTSKTVEGSLKQAEAALAALLTDVSRGHAVATPSISVSDYVRQYIEAKTNLRPGTRLDYLNRARTDIDPHIGRVKLSRLTPVQVQHWIRLLAESKKPRTVRYSYSLLAGAMKQAVLWGMLGSSPCRGIRLPTIERTGVDTLDRAEMAAILRERQGKIDYPMWVLAFATGMRPEEYLGLQWKNVDLDAGTLRVETALNKQFDGSYCLGRPKTKASHRTITLPSDVLPILREHRRRQSARIARLGILYDQGLDLVFAASQGQPLHISNVRAKWYRVLRDSGVKKVRLYAIRHTHASRLVEAGAPIKVISERLGHASAQITLDTYVQTSSESHVAAAELVCSAIFGRSSLTLD